MNEPADDPQAEMDAAYRAALNAQQLTPQALADAARRRAAVLAAVDALPAQPSASAAQVVDEAPAATTRPAAPRRPVAGVWQGLAAACVLASSTLLVVHLQQDPAADTQESRRPVLASPPAAGTGAGVLPAAPEPARVAESSAADMSMPAATVAPAPQRASRQTRPAASPSPSEINQPQAAAVPEPTPAPARAEAPATAPAPAPSATAKVFPAAPAVEQAPHTAPPAAAPAPALAGVAAKAAATGSAGPVRPSTERAEQAERPARALARTAIAPSAADAQTAARPTNTGWLTAAASQDYATLERLLASGLQADVERDRQGRSALTLAVLRDDVRTVRWLLEHGADAQLADRQGLTPIDHARLRARPEVLQALEQR